MGVRGLQNLETLRAFKFEKSFIHFNYVNWYAYTYACKCSSLSVNPFFSEMENKIFKKPLYAVK